MSLTPHLSKKSSHSQKGFEELSGRVAWITGASRGIGQAIALELAGLGVSIALGSRNETLLCAVARQAAAFGVSVFSKSCNVTDEDSIEDFVRQAESSLGPIDILVNSAGIYRTEPVSRHSLSVWREIIETNLTGPLLTTKAVVDGMIEREWGRLVNISSVSGKVGEKWASAYCSSKFGLIGFTQSLALEVAKYGITVNAVCPGWVDTEMASSQLTDEAWCSLNNIPQAESIDIHRLSIPQERFIEPQEVASLVAYLCSTSARSITGQSINICGGLILH
ncbi:MAG: SDR family oxidoreductase [Candidatus Melainabacteria bacterium]|nr:SDR family oxidoreductase [Candidatus Melainabacteria bacterium]